MTSRILTKHRVGAAGAPLLSDLQAGELALNVHEGRLYAIRDAGSPGIIIIGAETSPALAAALKEVTGGAFMAALGVTIPSVNGITQAAAQTTTSGTAKDFTGIPSWAKKITVAFGNVSLSGSANLLVQLGTSGGVQTTGYVASCSNQGGGTVTDSTTGFIATNNGGASDTYGGIMTIMNVTGNQWAYESKIRPATGIRHAAGVVTLSGALDRLRITTTGADTFDAGAVNIMWEG